ncbi:uncharacterized protein LOC126576911 [Anopheles aquasalis]|uniref:uncharacterized protein LOC126576911 n=1 Tax=Anopheles aquasalis TaxID=42839 RepID=UPI00215AC06F|nr:uncharacterized protein LOC126576911 [Anopheles aquasalis]
MALRIYFVLISSLVLLHQYKVQNVSETYAIHRFKYFQNINHSTLYDFVTHVESINKWMKFVTFVSSDQKSLAVGKLYKAVIEPNTILLRVVEYRPMEYITLESAIKDSFFQVKIELYFYKGCNEELRLSDKNHSALNSLRSAEPDNRNNDYEDLRNRGKGSGLRVIVFFVHTSYLFQNTIGAIFRHIFSQKLDYSLANLVNMLPHVDEHIFYR